MNRLFRVPPRPRICQTLRRDTPPVPPTTTRRKTRVDIFAKHAATRCSDNGNRRAQLRLMSDGSRYALYNAPSPASPLSPARPSTRQSRDRSCTRARFRTCFDAFSQTLLDPSSLLLRSNSPTREREFLRTFSDLFPTFSSRKCPRIVATIRLIFARIANSVTRMCVKCARLRL